MKKVEVIFFSLLCLAALSSKLTSSMNLLLGLGFAFFFTNNFKIFTNKYSKIILQISVALLGFGMNLNILIEAGLKGIGLSLITIFGTLLLGYFLGKLLRVSETISTLISSGTAICGGSAIAAVGTTIGASASEMSIAIGTVFILNAIALLIFPSLGHILNLDQSQFGIWSGISIHDVSSVVGAASQYGTEALQIATAVKLARTLWIIPLVFLIKIFADKNKSTKNSTPPYFILFFLLASIARSYLEVISTYAEITTTIAKSGFNLSLFLIGSNIDKNGLASVGWRAIIQGVLLWIFISSITLASLIK